MTYYKLQGGLLACVALALSGSVWAWNEGGGEQDEALTLTPDLENGMDVYEVCSACHLPEGWGLEDGTFPQLAGQHASVLIKQLADIRSLNRDNPTMYPFALERSIGGPQSVADVVAYTEKLPMNPEWGKGPWGPGTPEHAAGEKLYADNCVKCHGETGIAAPRSSTPASPASTTSTCCASSSGSVTASGAMPTRTWWPKSRPSPTPRCSR